MARPGNPPSVMPACRPGPRRGPDSRSRDRDSRSRPNRESGNRIGKRWISRFPIPAESGIGDSLPVSRPNRESGERELGISGSQPACGSAWTPPSCTTESAVVSSSLMFLLSTSPSVLLERTPARWIRLSDHSTVGPICVLAGCIVHIPIGRGPRPLMVLGQVRFITY